MLLNSKTVMEVQSTQIVWFCPSPTCISYKNDLMAVPLAVAGFVTRTLLEEGEHLCLQTQPPSNPTQPQHRAALSLQSSTFLQGFREGENSHRASLSLFSLPLKTRAGRIPCILLAKAFQELLLLAHSLKMESKWNKRCIVDQSCFRHNSLQKAGGYAEAPAMEWRNF